jgi:heme-degrading monooxygenase HmoA
MASGPSSNSPRWVCILLIAVLIQATEEVMKKQPGYISANIHKSLDGTKVTNYAQWRTKEDFEAMLKNPEVQKHMEIAKDLSIRFEPFLYEVSYTDTTS